MNSKIVMIEKCYQDFFDCEQGQRSHSTANLIGRPARKITGQALADIKSGLSRLNR